MHRPMARTRSRSSSAGVTRLGRRALLPYPVSPSPSIKIDLPNPCTYRNMCSIPPRDPLLPITSPGQQARQHAAACRVSLDRLVPTLLDASQACAAPHGCSRCTCCKRHAESVFCAPSVRSRECCRDLLSTSSLPGGPGLLSIHEWPVRPFLARLLYSLMRATNKQSDQACGSPAWLVPASWLSPFSLGAEEIIGKEKKSRRDMWAGWTRWQQYLPALLMRASTRIPKDTNKDCAVGLSMPTAVLARPAFMSAP